MIDKKVAKPTLLAKDFVHLHNHTQYSLLDGLTKIPALMDYVKQSGMQAVAITDHGTLSGLIEFYKEARERNVKPVFGMEAYVATRQHTDKEAAKDKTYYHLILLAINNTGYQNLMRLSTVANLDGFYYKPRIDHELLEKYNEGLIVLSGCIGGEVGSALRQDQYAQAKETAAWYKSVFDDRYYLEIQDHGHPDHPFSWQEQVAVTEKTFALSNDLNIKCVVTSDAHYLHHSDKEAHEILLCVQTGSFLGDEKRMSLKQFDLHVTEPQEIINRWGNDHPEVIENTKKIADQCNVSVELGKILIPKFQVPGTETEKSFLMLKVFRGLAWRYMDVSEEKANKLEISSIKKNLPKPVLDRVTYEMQVINKMNFNGFFLIVADFVSWGKSQGIIFGPGRGSAASSIVSYALNITELDPLQYDLLFERFLNPDRISMPDFDIDIQDNRRDEVIQYCVNKYGTDQVANIVTFGRMAARNAVRDVARVLQVPYVEADRLAKMLPPPVQGRHILLEQSLKDSKELKLEYKQNETARRVFDLAVQMEGTIRSHGVHAAGVVIAPDELVKFTPLEMAQKGVVATQYAMGPVEELGLLKIDFLGLSNLTTINNALRIIRKVHKTNIVLSQIPLDDMLTFNLLSGGDTTGVFQFESAGMKRFLKELKPNKFADIIAMVALYRPGPMAEFPRFIAGKNDPSTISYLHPSLEPVLQDTYGVIVFQEQIIALLQLIAGYTPGEADLVRKAIGKKKREIMTAEHPRFIDGCLKQGLTKIGAEKLWGLIQPFADYSFNKAHAACYALIAYQTAYLKANYPTAFMAAVMTSDFDDTDRLAIEINECKHLGIEVLPPDVNQSYMEFAVVPGKSQIRFGLSAIKNVGSAAAQEILHTRELGGVFANLENFCQRVPMKIVNKKTMESLIKAGAFDSFSKRHILLHNLEVILAYTAKLQKQAASGQTDIFGDAAHDSISRSHLLLDTETPEISLHEHLIWERELLGLYLSQHPLEEFQLFLAEQTTPLDELLPRHHNKAVTIGGAVQEIREITTKNGQAMAFVKIASQTTELELVLFPSAYQQTTGLWVRDRIIIAKGKISSQNRDGTAGEEIKILVNDAREITREQAAAYQPTGKISKKIKMAVKPTKPKALNQSQKLYVRIHDTNNLEKLNALRAVIDKFPGETEVVLVVGNEEQKQALRLPIHFEASQKHVDQLAEVVGSDNLRLH